MNVVWNQVKVPPCEDREHVTRVLQVEGPSEIVNEKFLLAYFHSKCRFDMEKILVLWEGFRFVKPRKIEIPVDANPATTSPIPASSPAPAPAPAPAPSKRQGRALASNNWRAGAKPVTAEEPKGDQSNVDAPTEKKVEPKQGGQHYRIMEFYFGTVKGQALACRMSLDWEFKEKGVLCRYGKSPSSLRRTEWHHSQENKHANIPSSVDRH